MTNHYWDRVSAPHADRDRSEPADRDADNVPSVEEPWPEYAEALRNPVALVDRLTVTDAYADGRDSRELLVDWQARACVAVEERRTAELRAEVEQLPQPLDSDPEPFSAVYARLNFAEAEHERIAAALNWRDRTYPCDGACVDYPEEDCSRHGRHPADLWQMINEFGDRAFKAEATIARVEALADSPPGDCYGAACIWPEDLHATLRGPVPTEDGAP